MERSDRTVALAPLDTWVCAGCIAAECARTLIAAARSAATSSNLQTWSVVAVTHPVKTATLAKLANSQMHIEHCLLFLAWLADISRNQRLGAAEGATLEAMLYLEMFLVAAIDAALAAKNAVAVADLLGLSTVYIGVLRNNPEQVAEVPGLSSGAVASWAYASAMRRRACQMRSSHECRARLRCTERAMARRKKQLQAAYDAHMAHFRAATRCRRPPGPGG